METKEKIFQAVQDIAREENIHSLTISDIAQAAGLARKTIYAHFSSKQEILLAMYTESLKKRYYLAGSGIRKLKSREDKLFRTAQISFNYYKKDKVSLLIHVYWSNIEFDLETIAQHVRTDFIQTNEDAREFVSNLFSSIKYKEVRDFYSIYYLDSIHAIIKRAILEPEFWTYKATPEEYFKKTMNIFIKGIQNEIENY